MLRCILLLASLWNTVFVGSIAFAQAMSLDVHPSPLVRLTGVVTAVDAPPRAGVLAVRVWFGENVWRFHVATVEPVMPAYRAWERLRDVSPQGLRLLADRETVARLEQGAAHQRPVTITGWLRPQAGVLRVIAVHVAE